MSLYSDYLKERTSDGIVECHEGFVTYRWINEKQVYIVDIFVQKEHRLKKIASKLADMVVAKAKESGRTELIGTVMPSAKGSHESLLVLIGYGMKLFSASENAIYFKKDI